MKRQFAVHPALENAGIVIFLLALALVLGSLTYERPSSDETIAKMANCEGRLTTDQAVSNGRGTEAVSKSLMCDDFGGALTRDRVYSLVFVHSVGIEDRLANLIFMAELDGDYSVCRFDIRLSWRSPRDLTVDACGGMVDTLRQTSYLNGIYITYRQSIELLPWSKIRKEGPAP